MSPGGSNVYCSIGCAVGGFLVCKISCELVGGLKPSLHGNNIEELGFGDLVLIFKVKFECVWLGRGTSFFL